MMPNNLFPDLQPDKKPPQGLWDAEAGPEKDICENRHRGATTSVEAFQGANTAKSRALVFSAIQRAGSRGITLHELADVMEKPVNAISGRVSELLYRQKTITHAGVRNYQGHRGRILFVREG
jgi:hypothetical protein